MFSHDHIWAAIDRVARSCDLSPSALARRAGLDSTTFNPSKRFSADGRPRWPSTESIAKVLEAGGVSFDQFASLVSAVQSTTTPALTKPRGVPLLGHAQAGHDGYFDDAGFPIGEGWDRIDLPGVTEGTYALEVSGRSMEPLYRDGDILVVSPAAQIRRGDRVVARTRSGEVMVKTLQRRTAGSVELGSINPDFPTRKFDVSEIEWIARVVWVSQ
ncbi:helix-turn-helix transcriptional regulator [Aureimonas sp. AU4]|uniref:S24 family peptidase n=1 Tax=Aureimonas sp. AU4 TaxID=1638163 RepID=UPI0007807E5A|nr:helix-turn-helix transcriptional regulator [Aureimonas sp. AU4]